jgi:tripartite-type tricarboxylate transporter receptor subunit TctC
MTFCRSQFVRRRFLQFAAATIALPVVSRLARPQAYPTRPVHIIVPLTAGSAADTLARRLAQAMGESWSQPVLVENRPGAGTTLGADMVAKAAPDGANLKARVSAPMAPGSRLCGNERVVALIASPA